MRVRETRQGLGLARKLLGILVGEPRVQELHGCMAVEVDVLSQVDLGETSSSQQTKQAIVAKLLAFTSDAVSHNTLLARSCFFPFFALVVPSDGGCPCFALLAPRGTHLTRLSLLSSVPAA